MRAVDDAGLHPPVVTNVRFQHAPHTTLKTDEGLGAVLDALGAFIAVGAALNRSHHPVNFGIAENVARIVHVVDRAICKPAGLLNVEHLHPADCAVGDEAAHGIRLLAKASLVSDHELGAVLLSGGYHCVCLGQCARHGLLADNTGHLGFGGGNRHGGVQPRPGADTDDIQVFLCQHVVIVGVAVGNAVLASRNSARDLEWVSDAAAICTLSKLGIRLCVRLAHPTAPDYANAILSPPLCSPMRITKTTMALL